MYEGCYQFCSRIQLIKLEPHYVVKRSTRYNSEAELYGNAIIMEKNAMIKTGKTINVVHLCEEHFILNIKYT